jgi:hypothetical protein
MSSRNEHRARTADFFAEGREHGRVPVPARLGTFLIPSGRHGIIATPSFKIEGGIVVHYGSASAPPY